MAGAELWTEVRVSFAGTLVGVTHLRPGQSFTLGEGPGADLTYAIPKTGAQLHRLIMATADGAVLTSLETGALVALGEDEPTCVELGALTIEVRCAPRLAPELGRRPLDVGWWLSLASTALVVVAFLSLTRMAAETTLPPIETEAAPYLAYTVRTEPRVDEPRPDSPTRLRALRPAPPERTRRASPERDPSTPAAPDLDDPSSTSSELLPEDIALARHARSGPQPVASTLQRDTSPVETAREAGILGVMAETGADEAAEAMVALAAAHFSPEVDDREAWAAMTGGSIDVSVAGLDLVGSGRGGGGVASDAIRSGAPARPRSDSSPQVAKCLGSACERGLGKSRARVVETRVDGELDSKLALRFANSLGGAWAKCLGDEDVQGFEVNYSVLADGRVAWAKVSATQLSSKLSSKSRRCLSAAIETHGAGPGPTQDGRAAKVVQRVELDP